MSDAFVINDEIFILKLKTYENFCFKILSQYKINRFIGKK